MKLFNKNFVTRKEKKVLCCQGVYLAATFVSETFELIH